MTDTMSNAISSEFIQLNMGTFLEWLPEESDALKDSGSESTQEPKANPCGGSIPTTTESSEDDEDSDSERLLARQGFRWTPKINSCGSMRKFQNMHRNASPMSRIPRMSNGPSNIPWEREIISHIYSARYGSERASFEQDDDGTIIVPKMESIKRELRLAQRIPTMFNGPSNIPWEREIISHIYLARYGSERASFEQDDDGTIIVPKMESIKRELRLAQQA